MFKETANPYKFKYLQTGITGNGIEQVYLPEVPEEHLIAFRKEQKWTRPKMSEQLKKWVKEWRTAIVKNPGYIHAQHDKIMEWENQEWERCSNGLWIWSNGVPTYLTPFYYWYLSSWLTYFGYPMFRETDKEICYWIQYWEEDPDSYGGLLNTIRRYGKSSIMGAWIVYRATRNFNHNAGMQGQTDDKIKKFYKKMVLKPFYKLPYYHQPTWNTDTKQTNQIEFDLPPKRGQRLSSADIDDVEVLESMIDYRASGEGEYDGDVLNSYMLEEPGKHVKTSVYDDEGEGTWDIVKPCLRKGRQIRGKCLAGTTVEDMNVADRGGKAYKNLFYDSDFNVRQADGRTRSGLYAAFLPGDCAYEDYLDEWGHPMRDLARQQLMKERDAFRNNPRKLAGLIRKYPLTIVEIFYVSPDRCEFNSLILQDRLRDIDTSTEPFTSRYDLYWENGVRMSKVLWRHNPTGGWLEASWMPKTPEEQNLFTRRNSNGREVFSPKDDNKKACGFDPIQHGSANNSRESKPVLYVKTKYDSSIDGQFTQEEFERNAAIKYKYKTNLYIMRMAHRPNDPNVLFERALMICMWMGVSIHVEKQMGGACINYFHEHGCGDFILNKYKPEFEKPDKTPTDGSSASSGLIQEYTSAYATYIEYFGHTIPFREQAEDALIFDASDPRVHDDTVAAGFTELACKMKPKVKEKPTLDLDDFFPRFDAWGNRVN